MNFPAAIQHYAIAIAQLEKTVNPEVVLNVLRSRDQVEAARQDPDSDLDPDCFLHLITLDDRLIQQAGTIHNTVDLEAWQKSLQPPTSAWWWYLAAPTHVRDRYDWLWSAGTVTALTASASLVVDICGRFLSVGAPGAWGSFAVISQSVLTLATAGGVLTDGGRQLIEQALDNSGLGRHWWQETKLGLSLALLLGLVGFHGSLPLIAERIATRGQQWEAAGNLQAAEASYQLATSLDQDQAEAHHDLGQLYAAWNRTEEAQDQLFIAVKEGYFPAYNSLATLYLENDSPDEAASLILDGLERVEESPETRSLRAELWSNLGWARVQQGRYAEARDSLKNSLELAPQTQSNAELAPQAPNRAGLTLATDSSAHAYCLLFQVAEESSDRATAAAAAQNCITLADPTNPQEDAWAYEAREYLQNREE
ncbi:MAG: tetratricopeptide repeat protein [Leptolyngbyaceae cyanobacterium]